MRLDELLSGLGRSIRWLIDQSDNGSGREPPAVEIQRTVNGGFRVGGFQFTSEAEALEFIKRRKLRLADRSSAARGASRQERTNHPVQADELLMAQFGIQRTADGGYRSAGYVFRTMDQAVDWAKRRSTTANPALRSNQATPPTCSKPPCAALGQFCSCRLGAARHIGSTFSSGGPLGP